MQRRSLPLAAAVSTAMALLSAALPAAAQASRSAAAPEAAAPQVYSARSSDGVTTRLTITPGAGGAWTGAVEEGAMRLALRGTRVGSALAGTVHEPASGLPLALLGGTLEATRVTLNLQPLLGGAASSMTLQREGAAAVPTRREDAAPAGPTVAAGGPLDARLVGRWHSDSVINSGGGAGGFASFSTRRTLALAPDGRVRQSSRSAGGGGSWSHVSDDQIEFDGEWSAAGGELRVRAPGQAAFTSAGRYRFVDDVLVIEANGRRLLWRR